MNYIKLSDYAKQFGCCYRTAWNRYKAGKIDGAYLDQTNHVLVPISSVNFNQTKKVALYARVSNNDAKDNLDRQLERLTNYAISNGYNIQYSVKEIASGLNDTRSKLIKLLNEDDFDILIVENKDRLTRFGFNYIQVLLHKLNKGIIVINQDDKSGEKKDLIEDMVSIIYSFSARIYGLRKAKNKQQEILKATEQ